ncbi:hypothetical protein XENTR_v10013145 [Xenopus tropicalis]|uniref:Coiled-coil domain-containing protein 167 n=3 Tax=Xenopus tropicalis TaxID=8364 RepID=CC167_XENTR|eukprot:NP_001096519.1 coiled-coil domain-containing protein 167 [Xenopus tropicalis]
MGKKKKEKLSVAREIDGMEEKVALCKYNLDVIDVKLRKMELTEEGRKSLEKEKSSLSSRLSNYERELKSLRHENRKNMLLSVAIFLLFAVGYYCWTL